MPRHPVIATASVVVAVLAIATAAAATPVDLADVGYYSVDVGTTRWDMSLDSPFVVDEATVYDGPASAPGSIVVNIDAFDGAWAVWIGAVDTTYYGDLGGPENVAADAPTAQLQIPTFIVDVTTTPEGDVVAQGPVESHSGLDVTVQHRYYADGDLVRVLASYTNPTDAPITVTTGTDTNLGSDSGTELDADSSGDGVVDAADRWMITHQSGAASDPVVTTVWARAGSETAITRVERDADDLTTGATITVQPGATVMLAYFSVVNGWAAVPAPAPTATAAAALPAGLAAAVAPDRASAIAASITAASQFGTLSGRLAAGIPAGAAVLNWDAAPAVPVVVAPAFTG